MFEIATQFNAIFRSQTNTQKISLSLLSMWISRRIKAFLELLEGEISSIEDSGALRDALDACIFFSTSMGRLGADFTPQIPPFFEAKMQNLVISCWKDGETQLSETLKICREAGVASPLSSSAVVSTTTSVDVTSEGESGPMAPPRQLMALPPLGRLVNAYLMGLNELRRCLLPGLFDPLRDYLEKSLAEVDNTLQTNERAVMTPGLRGDAVELRSKAKEMREVVATIVKPYVLGALELSLGNAGGASEHHDKLVEILNPPKEEVPEPTEESHDEGAVDGAEEKDMAEDEPGPTVGAAQGGEGAEESPSPANEGWNDGLGDIH